MIDKHFLGSFVHIDDVYRIYPSGGLCGDYILLNQKRVDWNDVGKTWGDIKHFDPVGQAPQTIDGSLNVRDDIFVGNEVKGRIAKFVTLIAEKIDVLGDPFAEKTHTHSLIDIADLYKYIGDISSGSGINPLLLWQELSSVDAMKQIDASHISNSIKAIYDALDKKIEIAKRESKEDVDKAYLKKLEDDIAQGRIFFNRGLQSSNTSNFTKGDGNFGIVTDDVGVLHSMASAQQINGAYVEDFISGILGHGWKIFKKGDKYSLEIDDLAVRGKMSVFELLVDKIRALKGSLNISQGSEKIISVTELPTQYMLVIESDVNSIMADDFIVCQVYKGSQIKKYHVLVHSINGKNIYVNKEEFVGGDLPAAGDEVIQFGNLTNKSRQSCIYIHADEVSGIPAIDMMMNVNSKDWTDKIKISIGGNLPGENGVSGFYVVNGMLICQSESKDVIYKLSPDGSVNIGKGALVYDPKTNKLTFGNNVIITWSNLDAESKKNLKGDVGIDGKGVEFIFKRQNLVTAPIKPNSDNLDDYVPNGWTAEQQGVTSFNKYEFVCKRVKTSGVWSGFSKPSLWAVFSFDGTNGVDGVDGKDGKGYEFVFKTTSLNTRPNTPEASQIDDYVPNGWTDDAKGVNSTYQYEWTSRRIKTNGVWGNFSTPALWSKYAFDGTNGVDGVDGVDGKTSYLHIKYSNDAGLTFTSHNGDDKGIYIGIYTDFTNVASLNVTSYTWQKLRDVLYDWLDEWNNNKTEIGGDSVISPRMFSGSKNAEGKLTGVGIGRDVVSIVEQGIVKKKIGVFGISDDVITFSLDAETGKVTGEECTFKNSVITGSSRSPFLDARDFGMAKNVLIGDNIALEALEENVKAVYALPDKNSAIGRRITLVNYLSPYYLPNVDNPPTYKESTADVGVFMENRPSDKFFFENGKKTNHINIKREAVELLGYGVGGSFKGWIVTSRTGMPSTNNRKSINPIVSSIEDVTYSKYDVTNTVFVKKYSDGFVEQSMVTNKMRINTPFKINLLYPVSDICSVSLTPFNNSNSNFSVVSVDVSYITLCNNGPSEGYAYIYINGIE